jgi:4-hydroxybenzoyl-CoA reductase subunit beta
MMRLPPFTYLAPGSLTEAAEQLAAHPDAVVVAGGTDLLPNMKRRQQEPNVIIGLRRVRELRGICVGEDGGLRIGAMTPLAALAADSIVRERYPALAQAAELVSTPHLRLMGTLGGNLCLDTRCTYYDQSAHWRRSIDFCKKCPGTNSQPICWVAPESARCWAVSSADTAPVAVALGARLHLVSASGGRWVDAGAFFRDDGIDYMDRRADEIVTDVWLPPSEGWRTTYLKLRRRGSCDFPVLGVAAAVKSTNARVEEVRLVLGAVSSAPIDVSTAARTLVGTVPTDEAIDAIAATAWRNARPLDNTDMNYAWRKKMARVYVRRALRAVCAPADGEPD